MFKPSQSKDGKKPEIYMSSNRRESAGKVNFIQKNKEMQNKAKLVEKNKNLPPLKSVVKSSTMQTHKTIPQQIEHLERVV